MRSYSTSLASDAVEPRTYMEVLKDKDVAYRTSAINGEIDNFYKRDVWKKVPRNILNDLKPLGTCWVFKRKSFRYKSRIFVKGYVQIPGINCTESFAPVPTDASIG
jgi:hypothetical protein